MPATTTLRNRRLERGQSLRELAANLGIDHGHLRRIERGDVTPGPRIRLLIAQHLDADVLELWSEVA